MTEPLTDPGARAIPTDRESLRQLVTALLGEPDIFGALARGFVEVVGTDGPLVSLLHQAADTDGSPLALHHTLGAGARQAAAGNHEHPTPRIWRAQSNSALASKVAADAEAKDTGVADLSFTARATKQYLIIYTARVNSTGGDANVDLRLRYETAISPAVPASPSAASASLYGHSVGAASGQPDTQTVLTQVSGDFFTGTGGLGSAPVKVAAFHDVVTGAGTITVDQASGALRRLIVVEGTIATG